MYFDPFVNACCDDPQPDIAAVGSQARFPQPKGGRGVDLLFRHETTDAFVHVLKERLECDIILPRQTVSPAAPLDHAPRTEARLRKAAARNFALYETLRPLP